MAYETLPPPVYFHHPAIVVCLLYYAPHLIGRVPSYCKSLFLDSDDSGRFGDVSWTATLEAIFGEEEQCCRRSLEDIG